MKLFKKDGPVFHSAFSSLVMRRPMFFGWGDFLDNYRAVAFPSHGKAVPESKPHDGRVKGLGIKK